MPSALCLAALALRPSLAGTPSPLPSVRLAAGEYALGLPPASVEAPAAGGQDAASMARQRLRVDDPGERAADEAPRTVRLSREVWLGATEVTLGLWTEVMGAPPAGQPEACLDPSCPAAGLSWCEAVAFLNRLSARAGRSPAYTGVGRCAETAGASVRWSSPTEGYRLPTEAEWEAAARAGRPSRVESPEELRRLAWTAPGAEGYPRPVASLAPNGLGLYDVAGNVAEWCWDPYGPSPVSGTDPVQTASALYADSRLLKGGSWVDRPYFARPSARVGYPAGSSAGPTGLRIASDRP